MRGLFVVRVAVLLRLPAKLPEKYFDPCLALQHRQASFLFSQFHQAVRHKIRS
jgi:hypothetical protein